MPLPPIPVRSDVVVAGGQKIAVSRWDAEADLALMLLLPTWRAHTAGYDRLGSAMAELGINVVLAPAAPAPDAATLTTVAALLAALRVERSEPPVVLAGHGIGGLAAAAHLVGAQSDRPDLGVLIAPALGTPRRRSLVDRLMPLRARRARSPVARLQAEVAAGWDALSIRVRVEMGGQDELTDPAVWGPLIRALPPGDASMYPALGHDLPNEAGWRDRSAETASWILRRTREQFPHLPVSPEGSRHRRMTRAEAMAEHDAYVASELQRLAQFRSQVAALGGPELEATRDGMARLGAWLLDSVTVGPRPDEPRWARVGPLGRLSTESMALIDGTASHVAASLRSLQPTLHWALCTRPIDAHYHQTVLEPIHLAPPVPATAILRELVAEDPDRDWLALAWDAWVAEIDALRNGPPPVDTDPLPLDEVVVDPYRGAGWDAEIWIPAGAEAVLGTARFRRLGDSIANLKGVLELAWEDRERMLVRLAPGTDTAALRGRVVGVLRRARRAAEHDPDAERS